MIAGSLGNLETRGCKFFSLAIKLLVSSGFNIANVIISLSLMLVSKHYGSLSELQRDFEDLPISLISRDFFGAKYSLDLKIEVKALESFIPIHDVKSYRFIKP
ncbi:hypothetical protein PVAND_014001 [Polypedilum vanderplanki]|uniref:Uncharacterized protein n=1 Tax=Polypedilum vanderplanki TaxID=319348 RepID=A0A9J6CSC2_POLVA|nr:hypothetical protein PVAND_014001 [Polypedilum vanderplanki]